MCVYVCVCSTLHQNSQIQSYVAYAFLNYAYSIIISFMEGHLQTSQKEEEETKKEKEKKRQFRDQK